VLRDLLDFLTAIGAASLVRLLYAFLLCPVLPGWADIERHYTGCSPMAACSVDREMPMMGGAERAADASADAMTSFGISAVWEFT
jgi:hypothetical protein